MLLIKLGFFPVHAVPSDDAFRVLQTVADGEVDIDGELEPKQMDALERALGV